VKKHGFTLIELMIVVVIVGILAAIAYPSYLSHVTKTRRTMAQSCLLELTQFMERYYTTNITYLGATLPTTSCQTDLADFYTFEFVSAPTSAAYTVQAVAKGTQANSDTSCGTLSMTHTGVKSPSTDCW
jgi:type IV pilus assembly protein PilE